MGTVVFCRFCFSFLVSFALEEHAERFPLVFLRWLAVLPYLEAYYRCFFRFSILVSLFFVLTYFPVLMIFHDRYDCYDYTKIPHGLCFSISIPSSYLFRLLLPFFSIKFGYSSCAYLPPLPPFCCFSHFFFHNVFLSKSSCISFVGGYLFAGYIVRSPLPFFPALSISCCSMLYFFPFHFTFISFVLYLFVYFGGGGR
ncbi:hypothetical protein L873DRAFT_1082470 [Choiromyces venosus 120613-1]|uniref:Uncharacterized protein n=1 Tax=Choiromyces venosus 120613-1 TaxID=1336337 RepID=A0A3N4JW95_9PEZI|nr:hypothetical protein L873DRAFT_1082470 [Choiromyces venosus 120613-1]